MTRKNPNSFCARIVLLFLLLLAAPLLFSACNREKQPEPPPAPAKPKPDVKPVVQKVASSATADPRLTPASQLDFSSRKDPFKPFVAVKTAPAADSIKSKELEKDRLPIHSYDVSQFKLIGTVIDSKGNKGMVLDPTGKGYVLRVGMTIGKSEGKIVKIDNSGVDVVEQFRDENNKIRKETIRIPLPRKP